MTDDRKMTLVDLTHTGPTARRGLTLAELMGVPNVPEETAIRLLLNGVDLGEAAEKRGADRLQEDKHAFRAHTASLTKAEKADERRALALQIGKDLRAENLHATVKDLSIIAHDRMKALEPETGLKAYSARSFENGYIPKRTPR